MASAPDPKVIPIRDGMANFASGRGTTVDRQTHNFWFMQQMVPTAIEAAYRTNWMIAKIIDLPPQDMCKAWRDWQADKEDITKLTDEEKRLHVRAKVMQALSYGRLCGGILLIGLGDEPSNPLPEIIRPGQLQYLHAMTRYRVTIGPEDLDPASPYFGQPLYFELQGNTKRTRIHPSRVIAFPGAHVPDIGLASWEDRFWGDSTIQRVNQAVQQATTATDGFASLIDEAKLDVWKLKGFMSELAINDAAVTKRVQYTNESKSTHRAVILDSEDEFEQRQITWAGMPEVIRTYLSIVAGAADIPATRLLGKAPDGMNATGEGDEKNYREMIKSKQDMMLRPALERLDQALLQSAGVDPTKAYWSFAPLETPTEAEIAAVAKTKAETVKIYSDVAALPSSALEKGVQNMLVEDEWLPGLDEALKDAELAGEEAGDDTDLDIVNPEGGDPDLAGGGDAPIVPARRAANDARFLDATPRTLYVCRKVQNVAEIKAWAKSQGLPALQDDLHVTLIYSRRAIDWMKVEAEDWNQKDDGTIEIPPGGVRIVEPLGDRTAVLLFTSSRLSWRHQQIVRAGAEHGFPDYQPHMSLTGDPVDLAGVEPYRGKIVLGPEIFEELKA